MAMKNAGEAARKWARNLSSSQDSIKQGVMNVTVNPAERAAARQDAYVQGVQRAVNDGKWQRGLRRVTLQSWQDAMITKGLPRISSGASAATAKVQSFLEKWLPHQEALKQKLSSMPRGDLQTNIARAVMAMEHNAAFKYQ